MVGKVGREGRCGSFRSRYRFRSFQTLAILLETDMCVCIKMTG